jgi:4'-phosphopantetheinyl transferase
MLSKTFLTKYLFVMYLFLTLLSKCLRPIEINNQLLIDKIFSETEFSIINNFKTLKKQVEWMCGRYAIKKLVTKVVPEVNEEQIEIAYEEFGAPFLPDFDFYNISITHSNDYAIGGISIDKNIMFGLDLERFEEANFEKSMQVAFSDREKEYLQKLPFNERYTSWTAKEAYLKYIKKGFHENLKSIEIIENKIYFNNQLVNLKLDSFNIDYNYALSVVYD